METSWAQQLQALLSDKEIAVNCKVTQALELLKSNNLAYFAKLKPRDLLVHPLNRGGVMVNAHDCWAKGMAIGSLGWSLQKIRQPVAFELPLDSARRSEIVKANLKLAEESQGMLAKPTGSERCCSVSASHTTAFLKSLESGCTCDEGVQPLEQLLTKGDDLGQMLNDGWEWCVVSWKAEEQVPSLPSFLQQALNSHLYEPKVFVYFCFCSCPPSHMGIMCIVDPAFLTDSQVSMEF